MRLNPLSEKTGEVQTVHAEITLKNVIDEGKAREGLIKTEDVRTATVQTVVDTGAITLVINEELCEKLGLAILKERNVLVANGQYVKCKETEPVSVYCKDRSSSLNAVVIPGAKKILLGVIPLEAMDLMVNPVSQELVGVHGDDDVILAL